VKASLKGCRLPEKFVPLENNSTDVEVRRQAGGGFLLKGKFH